MSYRTVLIEEQSPDGGTHWFAVHPQLHGCHAIGRTKEEALEELEVSRESWLRVAETQGLAAPPEDDTEMISISYLLRPGHSVGVAGKDPVQEVRIPQLA